MNRFWRTSLLTVVALFLETSVFYMVFSIVTTVIQLLEARVPFWLAIIAIGWSFFVSYYLQTFRFSLNLRAVAGLAVSLVSLVILSNIMTGSGWVPLGAIVTGDLMTAATVVVGFVSLVLLWWRGARVAQDEVTLDTIRGTFQWGMAVVFAAVLVDAVSPHNVVNGFLVLGYFAVGLVGLSMARFAAEAGDSQGMSKDWVIPIGATVGGVLLLVLIVSGLGLGGLDDVTRAIFGFVGSVGLWILKPVFLGLGYLAAGLAAFLDWLVSVFGGGDLSAFDEAQRQLDQFHESLAEQEPGGPPALLVAMLKWTAFLVVSSIIGWTLYRLFRFRRLLHAGGEVEETRESLFSWERANQDLTAIMAGWWNNLVRSASAENRAQPEPTDPRELYHRFLGLSADIGVPKEEAQTPKEHEAGLGELLPPRPVDNIVNGFQSAHYGHREADDVQMRSLLDDWAGIQQFTQAQRRQDEEKGESEKG